MKTDLGKRNFEKQIRGNGIFERDFENVNFDRDFRESRWAFFAANLKRDFTARPQSTLNKQNIFLVLALLLAAQQLQEFGLLGRHIAKTGFFGRLLLRSASFGCRSALAQLLQLCFRGHHVRVLV